MEPSLAARGATSRAIKWLNGPGKSIVTDPDVMADVREQVTTNLKDVTELLDSIAKLPAKSNVEKYLHKQVIGRKLIPSKSGINPQDLYVQP